MANFRVNCFLTDWNGIKVEFFRFFNSKRGELWYCDYDLEIFRNVIRLEDFFKDILEV